MTTALAVGGLAALPALASADLLTPDSPASGSAGATRTIYVIMIVLTGLAILAVIGAVIGAVRGSRGEGEPDRRTRGTAAIQGRVGAGLGAAVLILFVLGIVFTEKTREVEASESGAEPITIQVDGQQWLWRYEYPAREETSDGYSGDTPYSYYELTVPVDTPIQLDVGSTDVLHRWWVPALARSVDAVPGDVNTINFTADEVGEYEGRSTEFSGSGYASMRTVVRVVEPAEYEAFIEARTEEIVEARESVQERIDSGTALGEEAG